VAGVLTTLPRVHDEPPGRPDVGGNADHPMRVLTRALAAGEPWHAEQARRVNDLFDGLAEGWAARVAGEAGAPLRDALERGGLPTGGRCLELGSGSGQATPQLAARFDDVTSVDLSWEMLVRAPAGVGHRVRADAARLPVPDRSVAVVALVNALLFPAEVDRVLAPGGHVLWVSTLGDRTPIYLPAEEVASALPGPWDGVRSEAGWGTWVVLHRAAART
jgi:SAM-dependent methyltransferase